MLDRLLYMAVLPKYAFPTDVAAFHVFDVLGSTRRRHRLRYSPSQGLQAALSQYAPGKNVWVDKKLWTSGAIYSPIKDARFKAWQERKLYYECKCGFAKTEAFDDEKKGVALDCPACGDLATLGPPKTWLRPPGFAHDIGKPEKTSPDDIPETSYPTRAKLSAPAPGDEDRWERLNDRLHAQHFREHLLVTNRGPKEMGYAYCTSCGRIEPAVIVAGRMGQAHNKPFPCPTAQECMDPHIGRGWVLGTDFITDILLISISVTEPISLRPGLATDIVLRTVSEAICKAATQVLELEPGELLAEWRPALTDAGKAGMEAEIYLYDTLPGGAGFAKRLGLKVKDVIQLALKNLEECPGDCDESCYLCMRSYKNKLEHHLLDRHLGASLLRFALEGTTPTLSPESLERSTTRLFEDLKRQTTELLLERDINLALESFKPVVAPILVTPPKGDKFILALHNPLTPDHHPDQTLMEFPETGPCGYEIKLIDELAIRKNLPGVTASLIKQLA